MSSITFRYRIFPIARQRRERCRRARGQGAPEIFFGDRRRAVSSHRGVEEEHAGRFLGGVFPSVSAVLGKIDDGTGDSLDDLVAEGKANAAIKDVDGLGFPGALGQFLRGSKVRCHGVVKKGQAPGSVGRGQFYGQPALAEG